MSATPLPPDIERCPGVGEQENGQWFWREGCDDCARRTSPGLPTMTPPPIVAFECEARLTDADTRLIWQGRKGSEGPAAHPPIPPP